MDDLISVVIPVYNSESTIQKCIESIRIQSYKNWELLIIDDGSIDSTSSIIRDILKIDCRIRYFYKENGGPSSARNFGISVASGKYIRFIDSDDYIESDTLSYEVNKIQNFDLYISSFNFTRIENSFVLEKSEIYQNLIFLHKSGILNSPVNKIYYLDTVLKNRILFNENCDLGEDLEFNLEYIEHCNKVYIDNRCFYNILNTNDSLSYKFRINKHYLEHESFIKLINILRNEGIEYDNYYSDFTFNIITNQIFHFLKKKLDKTTSFEAYKLIISFIKSNNISYRKISSLTMIFRNLLLLLFKINNFSIILSIKRIFNVL